MQNSSRHPSLDKESGAPTHFLAEARKFLAEQLTLELRRAGRSTTGVHSEINACRLWHTKLYHRGWIAPAWPVAFGGTGWSVEQRFIFEQECAHNDAPILFSAGIRSLGPLLIESGTPEQRAQYLPSILLGDHLWCQGFSEAGAGSDLAALRTHAVAVGNRYLINGHKLWTTGAHVASHMFALVRTATSTKPQQGISFILIDMNTPGITVRPIITLDGQHEFNEVTFDDVSVPIENRVGAEHEGWSVAKQLMRFARSNNTNSSLLRRAWRSVERAVAIQEEGLENELRRRVNMVRIELDVFESLEQNLLASGKLSGDNEMGSSLMKVTATELHQRITEILIQVVGAYANVMPRGLDELPSTLQTGNQAMRKYLATRAATIYSGTNEIHRNLVAAGLWRSSW